MITIRRELQVAFSPRVQPWWFRLIKWSLMIAITVRYRRHWWFRYATGSTLVAALSVHFLYRWKTHGWQHPWGGWDDSNG